LVTPIIVIFTPSTRKAAHNITCSLYQELWTPMVNRFWW